MMKKNKDKNRKIRSDPVITTYPVIKRTVVLVHENLLLSQNSQLNTKHATRLNSYSTRQPVGYRLSFWFCRIQSILSMVLIDHSDLYFFSPKDPLS